MIAQPYSTAFRFPAPVINVLLGHPDRAPAGYSAEAQLDTGADRTVIPLTAAVELDLIRLGFRRAEVAGGEVVRFAIYEVAVSIHAVMDFVLEVYAGDEPHILLGRDVLNALHAHLDGPGCMLTLSAQPLTSIP